MHLKPTDLEKRISLSLLQSLMQIAGNGFKPTPRKGLNRSRHQDEVILISGNHLRIIKTYY